MVNLFSKMGEMEPCGIFTIGHFVLLGLSIIGIYIGLKLTKNKTKEDVKSIIKKSTIFLWILEFVKILFNLLTGNADNPNTYIPLYFCSLTLYAGLLSAFGKGTLKRVGDVFFATGGIVAGASFMLFPITSLTNYPVLHFISIQSFVLHSIMVVVGFIINRADYIEYDNKDFKYYFGLIAICAILAFVVNEKLGTNLMFISQNFPGTLIEPIYNVTGKLFPFVMFVPQATLPFFIITYLNKRSHKKINKEQIVV